MKNSLQTSVIGGKYRGMKLELPSLATTRSSKSILKESLFNTLSSDIIDENFIEMFAGSGSVMIEALSRGAKHGYAIEQDKKAYEVLMQNCKRVESGSYTCKRGDSFVILPDLLSCIKSPAYLYVDSPFEYREDMQGIYERCFTLVSTFSKSEIFSVVFEHMSILKMPESIGEFKHTKTKKFGKSSLSYFG